MSVLSGPSGWEKERGKGQRMARDEEKAQGQRSQQLRASGHLCLPLPYACKKMTSDSQVLNSGAFDSLCASLGWKVTPHKKALGHNCLVSLPHGRLPASLSTYHMQTKGDRAPVLVAHTQVPPCRLYKAPIGMCVHLGNRKHPEYGVCGSQGCHDVDTLVPYPW